jgi:hypothetical protein
MVQQRARNGEGGEKQRWRRQQDLVVQGRTATGGCWEEYGEEKSSRWGSKDGKQMIKKSEMLRPQSLLNCKRGARPEWSQAVARNSCWKE